MRSVGVHVTMARKGRPTASVVVVDGGWGSASLVQQFDLTSNTDDFATVLHELGSSLRSHLSGLAADRVLIRRADVARVPSNKEGPRLRLLAEGALTAAARAEVEEVHALTGKELADRSPASSKADLDSEAAQQVPGSPIEAAAAALVGLTT